MGTIGRCNYYNMLMRLIKEYGHLIVCSECPSNYSETNLKAIDVAQYWTETI